MPHLSPMNWIFMLVMVWLFMMLISSSIWWQQAMKWTSLKTLSKDVSSVTWKW